MPGLKRLNVVARDVQQSFLLLDQESAGAEYGSFSGGQRRAAQDGHLVEQRDAIFRDLADRVGELPRRQKRDGERAYRAFTEPVGHAVDYFLLKMSDQSRRIRLAHLEDTADDGLACLQQQLEELGRRLVVVAFVGGDINDDVAKSRRFDEPGNIPLRGPGGHVGTIPDDEIAEKIETGRIGRHSPYLVDVLIQARRAGVRETRQRTEKAEMSGPVDRPISAGVGNGVARETRLRVGLGQARAREHVGDGALAGTGTAHDDDVQRGRRLAVKERPQAVANQGRR